MVQGGSLPTPKIAENKAKGFRHDSFALEALAAFL